MTQKNKIMTTTSQCPLCAKGSLSFLTAKDLITYKSRKLLVAIEYSVCPVCREEIILPEQTKRNDERIKAISGYMRYRSKKRFKQSIIKKTISPSCFERLRSVVIRRIVLSTSV